MGRRKYQQMVITEYMESYFTYYFCIFANVYRKQAYCPKEVKHTYKFRWTSFIKPLTQANKRLGILSRGAFTMSENTKRSCLEKRLQSSIKAFNVFNLQLTLYTEVWYTWFLLFLCHFCHRTLKYLSDPPTSSF